MISGGLSLPEWFVQASRNLTADRQALYSLCSKM